MGLDEVLADLEGDGYSTRAFVIPACAKDAPHRRDRVWIVAYSKSLRLQRRSEPCGGNGYSESNRRADKPSGTSRFSKCTDVAYSNSAGCKEQWRTISDGEEQLASECRGRWKPEPSVGRVAHGIPKRVDRLRGLGNAIVPQVAYEIINALKGEECLN